MTNAEWQRGFDAWKARCDALCGRLLGMGTDNFPDAPWADYFTDGMEPAEACECAALDWWDAPDEVADMFVDVEE